MTPHHFPCSASAVRPRMQVAQRPAFGFAVIFIFALAIQAMLPRPAYAAAPPITENAYCGKGNVAQFGDKDGPAELPKACYYTALDGTPSPGKQIHVPAKSDLAHEIDSAKCGDTLLLPAGTSFEVTELPAKTSTTSLCAPTRPTRISLPKERASRPRGQESPAFPAAPRSPSLREDQRNCWRL